MVTGPIRVERADDGAWEMLRRTPAPGVAGHVAEYCGYIERSSYPVRRREVPHGSVVLILGWDEPIRVGPADRDAEGPVFGSFVAGLHERAVVTAHAGRQVGMQVDLTPLGAYRLFGVPMSAVANAVVDLTDVLGRRGDRLVEQLATAATWSQRFALMDAALAAWIADGPEVDRAVAWAWRQLVGSDGRVLVGGLAEEIGWSRRHFAARFSTQVGLTPKAAGRVLRFQRAMRLLTAGPDRMPGRISDVAAECGYADHSHLVRDFRALAGCTPSELLAAAGPDGLGIAG